MSTLRTLWNRRIVMRDGIELAADVFLPGPGRYPTLVIITPYGRSRALGNPAGWIRLVARGYALVTIDVRGRGDSGGTWTPWIRQPDDAHDAIEWAAAQTWSSARVGMIGGSYEARTQWWAASARPKHLKCIAPWAFGGAHHSLPHATGIPLQYWIWWMTLVTGRTNQYPGALAWEEGMTHLPLRTLDSALGLETSAWQDFVDGKIDFSCDAATLGDEDYREIDIPVFIACGLWDDQETFRAWRAVQQSKAADQCQLLVGAWDHGGNLAPRPSLGGLDVSASVVDTIDHLESFLARHLKEPAETPPPVPRCKVFLTGANIWQAHETWPPPDAAPKPYYFASEGDARSLKGNGRLTADLPGETGSDSYRFDPAQPMRDMSNLALFAWADPPLDYRYLQRRQDMLVYTSDPLDGAMLVSGQYRLVLHVSSDSPDTDLFVTLCDVHPDGRAIGLAATNEPPAALRLRYRNGAVAELLEPGRVYEIAIEGSWLNHLFKSGHRIRLMITSSNFPLAVRNAGTGRQWAEDCEMRAQSNKLHHGAGQPSRLILPVVEAEGR